MVSSETLLAPLEAIALGTEHAFLRLGLESVWSGHAFPDLLKWIQKIEIIGCKTDGVFLNEKRHGINASDIVRTSITKKLFLTLYEKRGNSI